MEVPAAQADHRWRGRENAVQRVRLPVVLVYPPKEEILQLQVPSPVKEASRETAERRFFLKIEPGGCFSGIARLTIIF